MLAFVVATRATRANRQAYGASATCRLEGDALAVPQTCTVSFVRRFSCCLVGDALAALQTCTVSFVRCTKALMYSNERCKVKKDCFFCRSKCFLL